MYESKFMIAHTVLYSLEIRKLLSIYSIGKKRIFLTCIVAILGFPLSPEKVSAQWGAHKDWMDSIKADCSPTLKGAAKRLIGEKSFWVDVNVSMSMWMEDMALMRYEGFCYAEYQGAGKQERLMSCLASVRRDIDWYSRCKAPVIIMCYKAGGFCK